MMSKIIKNIPVYLLWLAGLAITAHLIIIHDHHLADANSHQEDYCPVSNEKTGHSSGFPIHCCAFNDVTSEKATAYSLTRIVQCNEISICGFSDADTFEFQGPCITIFNLRKPFPDSYLLELSSLRAPPSIS
ncbi:MAG: hypothetical protein D4R64_13100 [Porphyromonadaceae bacterium]|nr:MAG: hypothetical protein D4R64_13100 [Porphyromonadaceae bacterium]